MDFCLAKNISKKLSSKCSPGILATHQKLLDHAKQSATDVLKTASKRAIEKTAEATGDLTGNKLSNKITKNSVDSNSETDSQTEEKNIYTCPEKRKQIIDDLRLIQ